MPTPQAQAPATSCQASPRCLRTPCFQVELHDPAGQALDGETAAACADHLGHIVHALAHNARARELAGGFLQVWAVDTPPSRADGGEGPPTARFPFATIPLAS